MLEYYYEKLLQAICFSNKPQKYLSDKILNPIFIKKVKEFLVECHRTSIFNYQMRENLLDIANYYRYHGEPELANEFILLINGSDINSFCWDAYLAMEYDQRRINNKYKFNIMDDDCVSDMCYALEMDYNVLQSLICDDEKFENEFLNYLMLDEFYFLSCQKMSEEKPRLFNNEKALIRICTINLANEKMKKYIIPEQKKFYKSIIKTGKTVIKKVIK